MTRRTGTAAAALCCLLSLLSCDVTGAGVLPPTSSALDELPVSLGDPSLCIDEVRFGRCAPSVRNPLPEWQLGR